MAESRTDICGDQFKNCRFWQATGNWFKENQQLQVRIKELEADFTDLQIDKEGLEINNAIAASRIKELEGQLKSWRDWARDEMEKGPAESEIPEFNDEIAEWDMFTDEEKESERKEGE